MILCCEISQRKTNAIPYGFKCVWNLKHTKETIKIDPELSQMLELVRECNKTVT